MRELVALTTGYAKAGQGLQADDDRAQTELALRESDLLRADEGVAVASARLAQQLRLDPSLPIQPTEPTIVPLELAPTTVPAAEWVATGLAQRPEVAESRYLVNEAIFRLRREQFSPLIPSVILGVSYGGTGGGKGSQIENFGDRFDGDAVAYWELRNFGLGDGAARGEASSRVSQARLREMAALDRVAREIVEAHTQVSIRAKQIAIAERAIQRAKACYERNLERIQNAQGLPLEVLQSIQALAAARREYLRVVTDFNAAQFQLLRAIGGTPQEALMRTSAESIDSPQL